MTKPDTDMEALTGLLRVMYISFDFCSGDDHERYIAQQLANPDGRVMRIIAHLRAEKAKAAQEAVDRASARGGAVAALDERALPRETFDVLLRHITEERKKAFAAGEDLATLEIIDALHSEEWAVASEDAAERLSDLIRATASLSAPDHDARHALAAAEAAALERAAVFLKGWAFHQAAASVRDLIPPISRTAYAEAIAAAEERLKAKHADEVHEVVAALYKAWPDAEDMGADWPLGIIGRIEDLIAERNALLPLLLAPHEAVAAAEERGRKAATDDRREDLKTAFVAGCCAVLTWTKSGMPQDDLDEAGYDYAASVLDKPAMGAVSSEQK